MRAALVIPVYNAEKYIADCLQAIAVQTVEDFEVVCVDDGSTDGSAAIVESFVAKDSRFRLIQQTNGGASSARNRGFDESEADYVTFVDADDEVSPNFLAVLLAAAEETGADVAIANKTVVTPSGRRTLKSPVLRPGTSRGMDLAKSGGLLRHIAPHAKLFRSAFLQSNQLRFYEGVTYEDYIYWLDVLTKDPSITRVPDSLYFYKKNPSSISSGSQRLKPFNIESRAVQTRECLRLAEESGSSELYNKVVTTQFENSVFRHVVALRKVHDPKEAQRAFDQLREAFSPQRRLIYRTLGGWRRLAYKLLLEGTLSDLLRYLRFVDGEVELSTRVDRKQSRPNLYVSRNELTSISTERDHFFNVADLIRK